MGAELRAAPDGTGLMFAIAHLLTAVLVKFVSQWFAKSLFVSHFWPYVICKYLCVALARLKKLKAPQRHSIASRMRRELADDRTLLAAYEGYWRCGGRQETSGR